MIFRGSFICETAIERESNIIDVGVEVKIDVNI